MTPPALADWLVRLLVRQGAAEDVIGDLHEEYARFKLGELGPVRARLWYWRQVLGVLGNCGELPMLGARRPAFLVGRREGIRLSLWTGLLSDLRYSVRRLAMSPGFSATSVLILALGVGGTAAVFSAVNGVLLAPLPYQSPEELVLIGGSTPGLGHQIPKVSPPEYRDYLQATSVSGLAAAWPIDATMTDGASPVRVRTAVVTPNFLAVLGVAPALGRDFREGDADKDVGLGYVAILSPAAWDRYFHRDPRIVGREIRVDDNPIRIIGVMPAGFKHPGHPDATPVDIWIPVNLSEGNRFDLRGAREFDLVGRLAPGSSLRDSQTEFERLAEAQQRDHPRYYPASRDWSVGVVSLLDAMVASVRTTVLLLFGSVGLVLLVVTTNIASLHLSRGMARVQEFAIRSAMGGSRSRIVRQLLLESLALGCVGCVGGVGVAFAGTGLLRSLVSREFPRIENIEMSGTVLAFALATSLLSVLAFGLLPSLRLCRTHLQPALDGYERRSLPSRRALRDVLVAFQAAASVVLIIGAGLLFKSFAALERVDLGFDPDRVLTLETRLPIPYDQREGSYAYVQERIAVLDRALREMERVPGVTHAALTSLLPLRGLFGVAVAVGGHYRGNGKPPLAEFRTVSGEFFETMGIKLLEGRTFASGDTVGEPRVVVVSKSFVDRLIPEGSPIGKRIWLAADPDGPWKIVGVVGDVSPQGFDTSSRETVYRPYTRGVGDAVTFVLKTAGRPERLIGPATRALQRADPNLPGFGAVSLESVVADARAEHRMLLVLFALFGLQTLLLAATGIYGVVSFAVARRTREIGVRLALGGARRRVIRLVLGEGLRLGILGALVGILAALGLSRLLTAVLFEVRPLDPWIFSATGAFTLMIVGLASLIPALRALRVNVAATLRAD